MYKKNMSWIIKIISIIIIFSVLLYIDVFANEFTDISGKWYEQTAINGVKNGWINGYPDGTFRGDNNITRAEFVTIINRMLNNKTNSIHSNIFGDVSIEDWYYNEILKAIELEIINGYEDGTFRPENNITRQDAIVVLSRLENLDSNSELFQPKDINNVSQYAQKAVIELYNLKILKGDENRNVNPFDNLTRAEAIALIERTYNVLNDLTIEFIEPNMEIKQNSNNNYCIYITNPEELYNYSFSIIYDSPSQLNSFSYISPINDSKFSCNYLEEEYITTINQFYNNGDELQLFMIDRWNYFYKYDGYIPSLGEKINIKIIATNLDNNISETYYIEYIVK